MVALNDLQQNAKNESQFLQIDYLLLILSTCGFGFVFICLLIVFVKRKLRNQKTNNLADIKMESVHNFMGDHEYFQLKPFMQQNNEIHNSSDGIQKVSKENLKQSFDKDEISENRISDNNDLNETGDSIENPYQTKHEELFTYMYPQIPLYNVFQSPNSSPGLVKPSILITEITSDDERNEKTLLNDHNNYNKEERISRENIIKVIKEDEKIFFEKSPRKNPFIDENRYYQDYIDENLKLSSSNQNADTNSAEIEQEKLNSLKSSSSGTSRESEEDSEHDSSSSTSINSSGSSNLIKTFKLKKAVVTSSPTSPLMMKSIADKLSDIEVTTENMKKINTQLLIIDNQIKDLPPVSQLENVNINVEPTIEYQISSKFETLQKDITNFLEKTENLEDAEFIPSVLVTDNRALNSNVTETTPNYQDVVENVTNRSFRDNIILNSGDSFHQDDLLVNSSESTISTRPNDNLDMANILMTSNSGFSSNPIVISKQPQISSSDTSNLTENLSVIKDQNAKYSAENLKEVSGSKYTKIFHENSSPFSFKIQKKETVSELKENYFSKFKNFKYHKNKKSDEVSFDSDIIDMNYADDERSTTPNKQIKTSRKDFLINNQSVTNPFTNNSITFPFLFQMKKEKTNSDLDSSGADDLKNLEGIKEKNENNDTEDSNNEIILSSKNQSLDDTIEVNKELDDSISSVDTQTNTKLTKQTNKNAFIDHESEMLKVHNFRVGNVQEAVKLFENVVTDKKSFESKSQVRYKRKI